MKDYLLLKTTLVGRQSSIEDILCWNTNFGQTTETGTLTINYHHRCKRKVKSWFLLEQSFKSRKRLFARGPLSNKSSFAGAPSANKKLFAGDPPANKPLPRLKTYWYVPGKEIWNYEHLYWPLMLSGVGGSLNIQRYFCSSIQCNKH